MSILLRKECQPLLDENGLSKLHVAVHDKTLTLDGECGKTLVTISGIRFATNNPKVAEIEYAAELLTTFLNKHVELLTKTIKQAEVVQSIDEVTIPPKWQFHSKSIYSGAPMRISTKEITIYDDAEGSITVDTPKSISQLSELYDEVIDQVTEIFDYKRKLYNAQEKLSELQTELVKCDI